MASGPDRYEYETRNGGEWGFVERVTDEGPGAGAGFIVEIHSRFAGTLTGERLFVPLALLPPEFNESDLSAVEDDGMAAGRRILQWLARPDNRAALEDARRRAKAIASHPGSARAARLRDAEQTGDIQVLRMGQTV